MKCLITFLLLSFCSFQTHTDSSERVKNENAKQEAALRFIHSYRNFCDNLREGDDQVTWAISRKDVTTSFKLELERILTEALEEDPELGLDFDPILNAQDYPEGFEIERAEGDYLIVRGTNWPEFRVTMKMTKEGSAWLVDGCGIVNIPAYKQTK